MDTRKAGDIEPGISIVNVLCIADQGIDDQPQILVAKSFKMRAAKLDPAFILNVGDNFYWGGIEKTCGTPMNELSYTAHHQFNQIFEGVYNGKGLDGKVRRFGRHLTWRDFDLDEVFGTCRSCDHDLAASSRKIAGAGKTWRSKHTHTNIYIYICIHM